MPTDSPRLQARAGIASVETTRERDGTSTIRVTLEIPGGGSAGGEARGHPVPESLMRAGARAALAALAGLTDDEVTMELRGTKAVRAFDSLVVVAAVRVRDGDSRRDLIGAVRAPDDDLVRGGILAALDAVNRFLGQRLLAPSPEGAPESDPEPPS